MVDITKNMSSYEGILKEFLNFRRSAENMSEITVNNDFIKLRGFFLYLQKQGKDWKNPDEQIVLEYLSNYENQSFNMYLSKISVFYKWYFKIDEKPDFLKRIKFRTQRQFKRTKEHIQKRQRIVTDEEYNQLQQAIHNPRDKALIELFYRTGARKGELLSTTNKSLNISDDGLTYITVLKSKTQTRVIPVKTELLPHTEEYFLRYYPYKDRQEEYPLFFSPSNPQKNIIGCTVNKILDRAIEQSDIKRKITPHDFRHTAITRHCQTTMSRSRIELLYGLEHGSQQLKVYDHTEIEDMAKYIKEQTISTGSQTLTQLEKENKKIKSNYENRLEGLEKRLDKYASIIRLLTEDAQEEFENPITTI